MSLKKVDDCDLGLHETAKGMLMGVLGLHLPQVVAEHCLEWGQWQEGPWLLASLGRGVLAPSLPGTNTQPLHLLKAVRTNQRLDADPGP